jgi:hypothetical protein
VSGAFRGWRYADRSGPFEARNVGVAATDRWTRCASAMVPGGMAVTAEYRPERSRHGSQYRARTKSHPGVRTGRKGKRQNESTKDDNRPRAHDRSPAGCASILNCRVSAKFPRCNPRTGRRRTAGRCPLMRRAICAVRRDRTTLTQEADGGGISEARPRGSESGAMPPRFERTANH